MVWKSQYSKPKLGLLFQIKQFLKTCSVANYTKKMRQLLEKIEENSKFIEKQRAKISFALSDTKMIAAWEASIRTKGTPLANYYDNWSKVNRIQKRKKVTKNDEIADDLPMIKRPKLTDKPKDKSENNGQFVLFPSDSEDEEPNFGVDDGEAPAAVKKDKKKLKKRKKANKVAPAQADTDHVTDQPDIVQDFSVTDW